MKTWSTRVVFFLAVGCSLTLVGCDSSGDEEAPGSVTFRFDHTVGGADLALNQIQYTNAAGNVYSVTLLEYIVTNIALQREDGTLEPLVTAHYRNAEDATTEHITVTDVPGGRYTAVAFTFGVEGAENVFGGLPSTTEFQNLLWPANPPMGDGTTERYHYMRLEGRYDDGNASFLVHTGPTGGADYSIDVTLPADIRVDGTTWEMTVVMDINEWFTSPNAYDFRDFGMIMGNASAQGLLQPNGATVFALGSAREQ